MKSYARDLQTQLASYKLDELGIAEEGLWSRNGRPYSHILPADQYRLNLCAGLRVELWKVIDRHPKWKRHADFHHLNSSQAMCWNVLMPARVDSSVRPGLASALNLPAAQFDIDFEVILDALEQTNFDCVLTLEGGGTVYVEAKLTEREFGTATENKKRLEKHKHHYVPRLIGKVDPALLDIRLFLAHYQLLRNLSYLASAQDRLVLVLPRSSVQVAVQAKNFFARVMKPWRQQVSVVFVEDIIETLIEQQPAGPTRRHFEECRRKYVLRDTR